MGKITQNQLDAANQQRDATKKWRQERLVSEMNKLPFGGSKSVRADPFQRKPGETVHVKKSRPLGRRNPAPSRNEVATSKGLSAAARRKLLKGRMQGREGQLTEDTPGYNPQTMGNRKYRTSSPAYRALDEMGEARIQETPQGDRGKHSLGAKLPKAAIRRRARFNPREEYLKTWVSPGPGKIKVPPLKRRESVN